MSTSTVTMDLALATMVNEITISSAVKLTAWHGTQAAIAEGSPVCRVACVSQGGCYGSRPRPADMCAVAAYNMLTYIIFIEPVTEQFNHMSVQRTYT